eukprot:317412-Amphidinium_carterae.1
MIGYLGRGPARSSSLDKGPCEDPTAGFLDAPDFSKQALIPNQGALEYAADCLLEDATFATEVKREYYHLLKLTLLSGRSTVVAAESDWDAETVLARCRRRLNLKDYHRHYGTSMELWHGQDW